MFARIIFKRCRMRKTLIFLLFIVVIFAVGCTTTVPPDGPPEDGSVTDNNTTPPLPAGDVAEITRNGDKLTVNVKLPADAGSEISLLALTYRPYIENWSANGEALLGIGQIKLDGNGRGSLTIALKDNASDFIVVINAPSGRYIAEVE